MLPNSNAIFHILTYDLFQVLCFKMETKLRKKIDTFYFVFVGNTWKWNKWGINVHICQQDQRKDGGFYDVTILNKSRSLLRAKLFNPHIVILIQKHLYVSGLITRLIVSFENNFLSLQHETNHQIKFKNFIHIKMFYGELILLFIWICQTCALILVWTLITPTKVLNIFVITYRQRDTVQKKYGFRRI